MVVLGDRVMDWVGKGRLVGSVFGVRKKGVGGMDG